MFEDEDVIIVSVCIKFVVGFFDEVVVVLDNLLLSKFKVVKVLLLKGEVMLVCGKFVEVELLLICVLEVDLSSFDVCFLFVCLVFGC